MKMIYFRECQWNWLLLSLHRVNKKRTKYLDQMRLCGSPQKCTAAWISRDQLEAHNQAQEHAPTTDQEDSRQMLLKKKGHVFICSSITRKNTTATPRVTILVKK